MTCIVGVRYVGGVVLAGDSNAGSQGQKVPRIDPKVFSLSPQIALGFTTSYRMGQILQHHLGAFEPEGDDPWGWTIRSFIPEVRKALSEHGYAKKENEREEGGTFLLAVRDRLFQVCDDFQVEEASWVFNACGSGMYVALGCLWAQAGLLTKPPAKEYARTIAQNAIDAAEALTPWIGGPITFAESVA